MIVVLAAAGADLFWRADSVSLPEAAAMRDSGELARQIAFGADPNRRAPVRAGVLKSEALVLTPLEAAVGAHRPEVIDLLFELGAVPSAEERRGLRCLAIAEREPALAELFVRGGEGTSDCAGVALPW